jgi:regulator of replication initiation timing
MNNNSNTTNNNSQMDGNIQPSIDMDIETMDLTQLREYSNQLLKKNKELENIKPKRRKTLQSCTAMLLTSDEILTKLVEQEANKKQKNKSSKKRKQPSTTSATPPKKKYQIKTNIQTRTSQFKLILTKSS